ncbi:MAG TPA: PIN domain-containing protein [Chloroflexi bacterium]|nr:PIN domain-containing protein [Chloroflexota bacterium]
MQRRAFIDTNVPMYAAGKVHPYKDACIQILHRVAIGELLACTDAEVHQEIFHRYWSIGLLDKALQVSADFLEVVPDVLPVTVAEIKKTAELAQEYPLLTPRDWLHLAVMLNNGITEIISADRHFDDIEGITRLDPREFVQEQP